MPPPGQPAQPPPGFHGMAPGPQPPQQPGFHPNMQQPPPPPGAPHIQYVPHQQQQQQQPPQGPFPLSPTLLTKIVCAPMEWHVGARAAILLTIQECLRTHEHARLTLTLAWLITRRHASSCTERHEWQTVAATESVSVHTRPWKIAPPVDARPSRLFGMHDAVNVHDVRPFNHAIHTF
jgi:hypothetical protein